MYPRLAVPTATDDIPPTHPNFFILGQFLGEIFFVNLNRYRKTSIFSF